MISSLNSRETIWPSLSYQSWHNTLDTLHLWTQIVGKIKLKQNSFINQWWEVAFFLTARGLTTGIIPYKEQTFEILFDFIDHELIILTNTGKQKKIPLESQKVAKFYKKVMRTLSSLGITVQINTTPSEMPHPIPFTKDTQRESYDKHAVAKWHQIQLKTSHIFEQFRSSFCGKSSPVQFFWGSFDLNTTRFSGKKLAEKKDWPKGYSFMRYAESEENFAVGFWPGDERLPEPAFYSYIYPAPKGYESIKTGSTISYFSTQLSECILPYEEVRKTKNPEKEILNFLETTYTESAKRAKWDINELCGIRPK